MLHTLSALQADRLRVAFVHRLRCAAKGMETPLESVHHAACGAADELGCEAVRTERYWALGMWGDVARAKGGRSKKRGGQTGRGATMPQVLQHGRPRRRRHGMER